MEKFWWLSVLLFLYSCGKRSEKYDVLFVNGVIYDGSGQTPYIGNLGIRGDTIAAIGAFYGRSENTIDVDGKAIAPGFINMLSWANVSLIHDGRSQSDIRQGVTLEVLGEGTSMGPLNDTMKAAMKKNQGDIQFDIEWNTLGEYLHFLEKKGISTNITSFVGNGTIREYIIGMDNRKATPEEIKAMQDLLDVAMQEGAVGISSSLLYEPSRYANTDELIALSKTAAQYGGMYISHIRDEGDYLVESVKELLTIAREAEIRAEIYHLKASGENNWHKMDEVIAMIDNAREEGLSITADMYTYNASSTGLHIQLPEWVRDGGIEVAIERLKDTRLRSRIIRDIRFDRPPDKIMFVGFRNPELRKYIGKRLSEVAMELRKSPKETMMDLIVEDNSRIQVVYFSMSEENIRKIIVQPWMSFCSDAGSYSAEGVFLQQSTHPRAYGSFARVIGKYSRDEELYPLEEGIRRLTSFPAEVLRIQNRGRLSQGYFADIVVFDPREVRDLATFEEPHQYAEGVHHVLVNGVFVLQDGEHTGAFPGRFVKGSGAMANSQ
ncbi:MAG TPA: D-aminoacylase [Saprospiraceae bacterium]|nr:D-aminoacylase [Saprospiraceae bacterium]